MKNDPVFTCYTALVNYSKLCEPTFSNSLPFCETIKLQRIHTRIGCRRLACAHKTRVSC